MWLSTFVNGKVYSIVVENGITILELKIILVFIQDNPSKINKCMLFNNGKYYDKKYDPNMVKFFDNEEYVKIIKEYSLISEEYVLLDDKDDEIFIEHVNIRSYFADDDFCCIKKTMTSKIKDYFNIYYNKICGYSSYGDENKVKKD